MLVLTHTLTLTTDDSDVPVPIRLYAPVKAERGWRCRFEIDWPDGTSGLDAGGVDALQALTIALNLIGAQLYTTEHHKNGELSSEGRQAGYGFPVPRNIADLLVGEDKAMWG